MVVAGRGVGGQRAERVEGRTLADRLLHFDVHTHSVKGDMPRSFDHDLHVMIPRTLGEFAQCHEFGELSGIIRISQAARTQTIPQREGDVVFGENLT